jgi:hypothetical protein
MMKEYFSKAFFTKVVFVSQCFASKKTRPVSHDFTRLPVFLGVAQPRHISKLVSDTRDKGSVVKVFSHCSTLRLW